MLTLAQSRRTDSASLFRDFVLSEGQAVFSNIFYVLPDSPRFSRNADGGPAFQFLWYRSTTAGDPKAGGMVTLTLELTPPADQAATLAQTIAAEYNIPVESVEIRAVPFKSGLVQLTYAGETSSGDFANQVEGNGPAQLIGAERATFMVDLSADGAALLWSAIEQRLPAFHLRYDLLFEHRLASVRLHVWCDVSNSLKEAGAAGFDPAQLRSTLIAKRMAGIEITSEQTLPADQQAALQTSGQNLLERALGSTLFAPADGKSTPKLLPYSPAMEAALNFTLDQSYPLEQHAVLDALLQVDLTPDQASQQIRKVDLTNGFFSVLEVQITCTVDFANDLISLVRATVSYDQTGDTGRVQRSGEFVFKAGSDVLQHFRTDVAAPGKTAYAYSVDVFYRGDHAPFRIDCPNTEQGVLVLDLDASGVLDVTLALRDVPFDKVNSVVVDLAYPSKGLSSQLILTGKLMSGRWQTVIAEARQPWRYKATWVLVDGRRIEAQWVESTGSKIHMDAPDELRAKMRVQVVAAGDFSDLNQILVDLRTQAGAQTQIAFTGAGQTKLWEAPALADGSFVYEYRRTLVYKDGRNRALDADWVSGNRPVLVIANDLSFRVQIVPKLLDLGSSLRLVVLELESEAAAVERKTFVVRTKTDQLEWRFDLDSAKQHKYRYRLTAVPVQGDRPAPMEWREADTEILVLQIPHN